MNETTNETNLTTFGPKLVTFEPDLVTSVPGLTTYLQNDLICDLNEVWSGSNQVKFEANVTTFMGLGRN